MNQTADEIIREAQAKKRLEDTKYTRLEKELSMEFLERYKPAKLYWSLRDEGIDKQRARIVTTIYNFCVYEISRDLLKGGN